MSILSRAIARLTSKAAIDTDAAAYARTLRTIQANRDTLATRQAIAAKAADYAANQGEQARALFLIGDHS